MFSQIQFEPNLSIGDIISSVSLLVASGALLLNWWQLRKDSVRKRAEFIINLFNQYLTDADAVEMFYRLEHGGFTFDASQLFGSPDEIKLDKLLHHFDTIAQLNEMGALDLEDLGLIKYHFLRLYRNPEINNYLARLDEAFPTVAMRGRAFNSFQNVALKIHAKEETSAPASY